MDIPLLIQWMEENKANLFNVWNDDEVVRIRETVAYWKFKETKEAEEFVAICKFYYLMRQHYQLISSQLIIS